MNRFAITLKNIEDISFYGKNKAAELIVFLKGYCFSGIKQLDAADLSQVIEQAKAYSMDVSVSMNRLFFPDEIEDALHTMEEAVYAGAYVLFGDPALLRYALKKGFAEKLIYQPETLVQTAMMHRTGWIQAYAVLLFLRY